MKADDLIARIAAQPETRAALEELDLLRRSTGGQQITARVMVSAKLTGEQVPVVFSITVGNEGGLDP